MERPALILQAGFTIIALTVAEKSSPDPMAAIHAPGEGVLEPFYSSGQIGNRSFHNPVIGHQHLGMDPPTGF